MNIKDKNRPELQEFFEIISKIPNSLFPKNLFKFLLSNIGTTQFILTQVSKSKEEVLNLLDKRFLGMQEKLKDLEEKSLGLEHRIEVVKKKSSSDTENFSRKILEVSTFLASKPWSKEISEFNEKISSKPSFEDIFVVKADLEPKIEENLKAIQAAQRQVKDFEGVIARMDEILLEKSSKEDIRFWTKQLNSYFTAKEVDKLVEDLDQRVSDLESFKKDQTTIHLKAKSDSCSKISHKNMSKDFSILFNKVNLISSKLDEKVSKFDFFPLIENFEVKEIMMKKYFDSLLNDLSQVSILQQESLKTMIRNLDSAEKKNKIRGEILKASEKLVTSLTMKMNDNKFSSHSKSASFARNSISPENDRLPSTSLSQNRRSKRIFIAKNQRMNSNG
jgi:hypothetical protein